MNKLSNYNGHAYLLIRKVISVWYRDLSEIHIKSMSGMHKLLQKATSQKQQIYEDALRKASWKIDVQVISQMAVNVYHVYVLFSANSFRFYGFFMRPFDSWFVHFFVLPLPVYGICCTEYAKKCDFLVSHSGIRNFTNIMEIGASDHPLGAKKE